MIVQMDTVECEKAGNDSLLAAHTHPFDGDTKQRVYRVAAETGPSEQNFGDEQPGFMHGALGLADDTVNGEPVSGTKFPANREINREFRRNRPCTPIFASDQHADPKAYSRIPYATKQGISKRVSGNCFQGTGNFDLRSKRPLFARLFCACRTRSVLTGLFASGGGTDGGRMALSRALRRGLLARAP